MSVILYIVIDSAGGHGIDLCVAQYTTMLCDELNITLIHQVSRSPYCTALDLCFIATYLSKYIVFLIGIAYLLNVC